jgi:hypothetical protein
MSKYYFTGLRRDVLPALNNQYISDFLKTEHTGSIGQEVCTEVIRVFVKMRWVGRVLFYRS